MSEPVDSDKSGGRGCSLLSAAAVACHSLAPSPPHFLRHANWIRAHSQHEWSETDRSEWTARRIRRAEKQPNGRTVKKATKTTKQLAPSTLLLAGFEEQREEEKEANAWTDE